MATSEQLKNLAKARAVRAANLKKAKNTVKKPVKKAVKKTVKKPVKKTVKKNPIPSVLRYSVKVTTFARKVGYLKKEGGFDTDKHAAYLMTKLHAEKRAREVFAEHVKYLYRVEVVDIKKPNAVLKNNPVPPSLACQINEASYLLEDFTGHKATKSTKHVINIPKVALQVGQCDAILYTTTRDGVVEHYKHTFKKRSAPILAASHDGKDLVLVGGNYNFTNRGIVDN